MASEATITVNALPSVDETFTLRAKIDTTTIQDIVITFKTIRSGLGESTIGSTVQACATNLKQAIEVDYNNTSLYGILMFASGDAFTIISTNPQIEFEEITNTSSPDVVISISNDAESVFTIDNVVGSEADTTPCSNVKITVTTNIQADSISSPISQAVAANPFVFEIARTSGLQDISMVKDGETITKKYLCPLLLEEYFTVQTSASPGGTGTVVINPTPGVFTLNNANHYYFVNLEYSLNNVDWQTNNSWVGLAADDYTLYIRDNLGCSISIDFTIDSFTPNVVDYDAVLEISNINSIRFKKNESWGTQNPKTSENTLSFEEDVELPNNGFLQLFQPNDIIKTQIKTNWELVTAKLIDCDDNETSLTVNKVTDNMNITDVRDGTIIQVSYLGSNYVGVRFGSGNTYDADTLVQNGTYNLGEKLPTWINIGDYLNVQGVGWSSVVAIEYSNGYYTAILNLLVSNLTVPLGTYKVTSVYNSVDFERYEFSINFLTLSGYYKVQVDVTDSTYGTSQFISEWMSVKDEHCKTYRIDYYNTEANEINYNTGIQHRLRIPYAQRMRWNPDGNIDVYETDTNTVNLESRYRSSWEFKSLLLPTMMAEKLVLALMHDRLFINGQNYVCLEKPERNAIGSQYQIIANLVKGDYTFDSNNTNIGEIVLREGEALAIDSSASGFLYVD